MAKKRDEAGVLLPPNPTARYESLWMLFARREDDLRKRSKMLKTEAQKQLDAEVVSAVSVKVLVSAAPSRRGRKPGRAREAELGGYDEQVRRAYEMLPASTLEELKQAKLASVGPALKEVSDQLEVVLRERHEQLSREASAIEFETVEPVEMWARDSRSNSDYRSQGFAADDYAVGAMRPEKLRLFRRGFRVEIRQWYYDAVSSKKTYVYRASESPSDIVTYELWTDAPIWACDAAARLETLDEWLAALGPSCNPCVFCPGLEREPDIISRWIKAYSSLRSPLDG